MRLATDNKILSRAALRDHAKRLHESGARIVTCNGSFDLFHYGHLYFLSYARAQGDALIVGVNSDASVKRYKSPSRPIVPEEQRASVLAGLACVTYVHVFDEDVPMPFISVVQPHVHVNGEEYGAECIEAETVHRYGGEIRLVPKVAGLSTTALITRVQEL